MPGPAASRAAALIAILLVAVPAGAASLDGPGFTLAYDDVTWRPLGATPPVLAALACIRPGCPPGTTLMLVDDARPLPQPGASPRSPGAVSNALLGSRVAALLPGRRALAAEPQTGVRLAGRSAVQGRFAVEHRDLGRSALLDTLIALPGRSLHLALFAPTLTPRALAAYDQLLPGLVLTR